MIAAPLSDLILMQGCEHPADCLEAQLSAKKEAHRENRVSAAKVCELYVLCVQGGQKKQDVVSRGTGKIKTTPLWR